MKLLSMKHYEILLIVLLFSVSSVAVQAQDDAEAAAAEEIKAQMKADKTGTNPLNFTFDARLYNEFQWLNTPGDGTQNISTFEFRAPFADGKWQFRSKVRGVNLEADLNDDGSKDIDTYGLGDTDIRFMTIPYLKSFGVATGVEFFLDTASQDPLGTGANSAGPFIFLGIFNPIGKGSILVPGYQHIVSFDEDSGRSDVERGLIDLFLVKTWGGNQFWGFVDPQILLDYENNTEFMLLEFQAGMMTDKYFGTKGHSVYIMPSFGVGGHRPYNFSLEVGYKIVW